MRQRAGRGLHVVLTGGACSGKTTTVRAVAEQLRADGLAVAVMDEAATAFVEQTGISIGTLRGPAWQSVQMALVARMRDNRDLGVRLGRAGVIDVVLYDRGELDGVPYLEAGSVEAVLAEHGETIADLEEAYDLVCYLEAGPYETESNAARHEDADVAQQRGEELAQAWGGHPGFVTIAWEEREQDKAVAVGKLVRTALTPQQDAAAVA